MKYTIHVWKTPAGCLCGSGSSTSQRFHGELWFRRDGQKPQSSVVGGSPRFAWRCRCIHWYDMYNIYIYIYTHTISYNHIVWYYVCMYIHIIHHTDYSESHCVNIVLFLGLQHAWKLPVVWDTNMAGSWILRHPLPWMGRFNKPLGPLLLWNIPSGND